MEELNNKALGGVSDAELIAKARAHLEGNRESISGIPLISALADRLEALTQTTTDKEQSGKGSDEQMDVYLPEFDQTVTTTISEAIKEMADLKSQGWGIYVEAHFMLAIQALEAAQLPARPVVKATHRHKESGTEYVLIGVGKMQADDWFIVHDWDMGHGEEVDMREVAIYRSVDDGSLWVSPREEFEDGRFEILSALSNDGRE